MIRARIKDVLSAIRSLSNLRGVTLTEVKKYVHKGCDCEDPPDCKRTLQIAVDRGFLRKRGVRYFPITTTAPGGVMEKKKRRTRKGSNRKRLTKRRKVSHKKTCQMNNFTSFEATGCGKRRAQVSDIQSARRRRKTTSSRRTSRNVRRVKTRRSRKSTRNHNDHRRKGNNGTDVKSDEDFTPYFEEQVDKSQEYLCPPQ